jgi:hypothetical protein
MFPPLAFSSKTESELELKPLNDSNEDINRLARNSNVRREIKDLY